MSDGGRGLRFSDCPIRAEPAGAHNPGKRDWIIEGPSDFNHHKPGCVSGTICKLNYSDALKPKNRKTIFRTSASKRIAFGEEKRKLIAPDERRSLFI